MRRRLRNFLPIVLIALAVQIFAPIGACWAASIAASDPLRVAVICHGDAASAQGHTDQTGQLDAHSGCCSVCSLAYLGGLLDAPQSAIVTPYLVHTRVVWLDRTPDPSGSRTGHHAQARAPPLAS
jgi:hypothetical protein